MWKHRIASFLQVKLFDTQMIFFEVVCIGRVFVPSTSLLMFFLSFQGFLAFFNTCFTFVKSLVPACTIRVSCFLLTGSSISSKMVFGFPPGKFFILMRLSFDSPFSFMLFNKLSTVNITLGFLADFSFLFVVFFIVALA